MKKSFAFCLCLCLSALCFAQEATISPELQKGFALYKQDSLDAAEKVLEALVRKEPKDGDAWDLLAKVRQDQYYQAKKLQPITDQLFGGNITFTTKDKKGRKVKGDDSLAKQLMEMLRQINPTERAYSKLLYTVRKATSATRTAYHSSVILRNLALGDEMDTNVSDEAYKYYREAEKEFEATNYGSAAQLYRKALTAQPDFYKAALYLGDSYYMTENYADAVTSFKDAVTRFPTALEPRKYLMDAYIGLKLYKNAIETAIGAMSAYPDYTVAGKLEALLEREDQRLDIRWTSRPILPISMAVDTGAGHINDYAEEHPAKPSGPWVYYTAALEKARPYCNAKGILAIDNPLTKTRYLEVYAWEEMLQNSTDPILAEARRMQAAGYLEPYVLVTCFHQDFYDQYGFFTRRSGEKIPEYYTHFTKKQ